MIVMTAQMQLKVDIISKVSEGRLSKEQASLLLGKSVRSIERYLKKYNECGIQFVVHGNTGCSPVNKISNQLKKKVQRLHKKKYYDFNLTHLKEKLLENESIDVRRETLRVWAKEIRLVKKTKRRRGKKRTHRDRMPSEGLMVQLDGSPHNWFGKNKTCLIAAVDDATSELFAEFFESETTLGCMMILKQIIQKKGLFHTLYVDRAGIFGGHKRQMFSQLKRACEELGIEIIFANSPEAKGRIERVFQTLQDRLVAELRLKRIKTLSGANKFLKQTFVPEYWNLRLAVKPESEESFYRPCLKNLDDIFVIKKYRKVSKGQTISYGCRDHLIEGPKNLSLSKHQVELRVDKSGEIQAYFTGKKLKLKKIKKPTRVCSDDINIEKTLKALQLVKKTGNVALASREAGVSRQKIYRAKDLIEKKGLNFFKKTFGRRLHFGSKQIKLRDLIVNFSIKNPHLGEDQVALHLNKIKDVDISKGTVRHVWMQNNMQTIALRVLKSEAR